ncbi:recombinase family protein, partial [Bacillus thuringiensis]|nr:recombinase family protein [Bacillus thuringiensis]
MIFGYARVSTRSQNLDMQWDELKRFWCKKS